MVLTAHVVIVENVQILSSRSDSELLTDSPLWPGLNVGPVSPLSVAAQFERQ